MKLDQAGIRGFMGARILLSKHNGPEKSGAAVSLFLEI